MSLEINKCLLDLQLYNIDDQEEIENKVKQMIYDCFDSLDLDVIGNENSEKESIVIKNLKLNLPLFELGQLSDRFSEEFKKAFILAFEEACLEAGLSLKIKNEKGYETTGNSGGSPGRETSRQDLLKKKLELFKDFLLYGRLPGFLKGHSEENKKMVLALWFLKEVKTETSRQVLKKYLQYAVIRQRILRYLDSYQLQKLIEQISPESIEAATILSDAYTINKSLAISYWNELLYLSSLSYKSFSTKQICFLLLIKTETINTDLLSQFSQEVFSESKKLLKSLLRNPTGLTSNELLALQVWFMDRGMKNIKDKDIESLEKIIFQMEEKRGIRYGSAKRQVLNQYKKPGEENHFTDQSLLKTVESSKLNQLSLNTRSLVEKTDIFEVDQALIINYQNDINHYLFFIKKLDNLKQKTLSGVYKKELLEDLEHYVDRQFFLDKSTLNIFKKWIRKELEKLSQPSVLDTVFKIKRSIIESDFSMMPDLLDHGMLPVSTISKIRLFLSSFHLTNPVLSESESKNKILNDLNKLIDFLQLNQNNSIRFPAFLAEVEWLIYLIQSITRRKSSIKKDTLAKIKIMTKRLFLSDLWSFSVPVKNKKELISSSLSAWSNSSLKLLINELETYLNENSIEKRNTIENEEKSSLPESSAEYKREEKKPEIYQVEQFIWKKIKTEIPIILNNLSIETSSDFKELLKEFNGIPDRHSIFRTIVYLQSMLIVNQIGAKSSKIKDNILKLEQWQKIIEAETKLSNTYHMQCLSRLELCKKIAEISVVDNTDSPELKDFIYLSEEEKNLELYKKYRSMNKSLNALLLKVIEQSSVIELSKSLNKLSLPEEYHQSLTALLNKANITYSKELLSNEKEKPQSEKWQSDNADNRIEEELRSKSESKENDVNSEQRDENNSFAKTSHKTKSDSNTSINDIINEILGHSESFEGSETRTEEFVPDEWRIKFSQLIKKFINEVSRIIEENKPPYIRNKKRFVKHDKEHITEIKKFAEEALYNPDINELVSQCDELPLTEEEKSILRTELEKIARINEKSIDSKELKLIKDSALSRVEELKRAKMMQEKGIETFDAGLVIFGPYLERFFTKISLLNEERDDFKNEEARLKAHGLLLYLLGSNEDELSYVTANLLVGYDMETVISERIILSEEDIKAADILMFNIINNWEILKSMDVKNFQKMFLQRHAECSRTGNGWLISVEHETRDILLAKLPWSISLLKLKWLGDEMIHVNWKTGF